MIIIISYLESAIILQGIVTCSYMYMKHFVLIVSVHSLCFVVEIIFSLLYNYVFCTLSQVLISWGGVLVVILCNADVWC